MKNKDRKNPLNKIIKMQTNKSASFFDLEARNQGKVLKYIKENSLNIRIFNEIWYDIITNKFYASEYIYTDETVLGVETIKHTFDSFAQLYECVNDEIYNNSCFFGYTFSKEEIAKYHLEIKRLNNQSFIKDKIDNYTFEKNIEKNKYKEQRLSHIAKWMFEWANEKEIITIDDLEKSVDYFCKFVNLWYAKRIFFSLLIKRNDHAIRNLLIEYACKHDLYDGFSFDDVLYFYGTEAAEYVINNYDGVSGYSTKRRRINSFEEKLKSFLENNYSVERRIRFDSDSHLYIVRDEFVNDKKVIMCVSTFFYLFSDLTRFLNFDLSGANLLDAPITKEDLANCKIDEKTIVPFSKKYSHYTVEKKYENNEFVVEQKWFGFDNSVCLQKKHEFCHFFDFVYFLNGDLSNSDLLLCDGIENIKCINGLNINGLIVNSKAAKELGIKQEALPQLNQFINDHEEIISNELITADNYLSIRQDDGDYSFNISYISDIHLLHRFIANKCETDNDAEYVIRKIANTIGQQSTRINLITGDLSSNYIIYKRFISHLASNYGGDYFITLGNHELWSSLGSSLEEYLNIYKELFDKVGNGKIHLLHNNLFFFTDSGIKEIDEETLSNIDNKTLREKARNARLVIFGGIGFAGTNAKFNSDNGIYKDTINRDTEIMESAKFYNLYSKIVNSLSDKHLIVATHMPLNDWGGDSSYLDNIVYVSGHNHRNFYFDNGKKRIYADNQVGYKGKAISLKRIAIDHDYDWFADYKDGIYEITKKDYEQFYRGIGEAVGFNREFDKLYLIKREHTYMFLMKTLKGSLLILNGGAIKKAGDHSLDYFYENLAKYSKSVEMFLLKYDDYQKRVSSEIKKIGGDGTIHGSIIDIDFYNHIYLNPIDWSATPYFAYSMVDKYVYNSLPSLLKSQLPKLYNRYIEIASQNLKENELILYNPNVPVTNKRIYVKSTEMYKISRILKGLQFTTKYNVVRIWNDAIVANATEENGRMIVENIISPKIEALPNRKKTK